MPHQCLWASMWIEKALLPCWPTRGTRGTSRNKESAGVAPKLNLKDLLHASKGIHPVFKSQGRCHQKSETGVSVAPQKGLNVLQFLPTAREGNGFTGICHSVHNRSHGYSVTAHPCYGAVGTHTTGMLSFFKWPFLAWVLSRLCATDSSDSPLVRHLLTSWRSG